MKTLKILLASLTLITISFLYSTEVFACPKCNEDFRNQLMNERKNSLGAKELLKAIENQTDSNQYISSPVVYKGQSDMTPESKQVAELNNDKENSVSLFDKIKMFVHVWLWYM